MAFVAPNLAILALAHKMAFATLTLNIFEAHMACGIRIQHGLVIVAFTPNMAIAVQSINMAIVALTTNRTIVAPAYKMAIAALPYHQTWLA